MRVLGCCLVLTLCAACGQPTPPASRSAAESASAIVNPAYISKSRSELPPGYEVGDLAGRSSPIAFWGLGPQWSADPPQCGALGQPAPPGVPMRGWSASGPGGIVYAAVVDTEAVLDPALPAQCGSWTVTAGHTGAHVSSAEAPRIDDADTAGMVADTSTVVEGGSETHSRAETFSAYLPGHVVFVTVVTDPGATGQALAPDFAATLVVATVDALRGG